jgi:hypothetical protein
VKRALYYTIRRSYSTYDVFTVTSVKGHRIYGRDRHQNPSNGVNTDFTGKFDTYEEALKLVDAVAALEREKEMALQPFKDSMKDVNRHYREKVDALLKEK